jgi:hypothetical protein
MGERPTQGCAASLRKVPSALRARIDAIVEWAWDYFMGEHAEQLIDR